MIIGLAVIFLVVVGGGVVLAGFIRRLGDEIQTNTKIARACAEVRTEIWNVRQEMRGELMEEIRAVRDEIRGVRIG